MTREEIRAQVLGALAAVAPEVDPAALEPERNFRDQCDMDSVDFMNLVLSLEERFGLKLPEASYPGLSSLNGCVDVLSARLGGAARSPASAPAGARGGGRAGDEDR